MLHASIHRRAVKSGAAVRLKRETCVSSDHFVHSTREPNIKERKGKNRGRKGKKRGPTNEIKGIIDRGMNIARFFNCLTRPSSRQVFIDFRTTRRSYYSRTKLDVLTRNSPSRSSSLLPSFRILGGRGGGLRVEGR